MGYSISAGIKESDLSKWLKSAGKDFGHFQDGRVDYTNASIAPIVMCTILCRKQILIVKRGYGLADAEGYWSTVNGFIDEDKPLKQLVQQEISEELNLKVAKVVIKVGTSYTLANPQQKRQYIVFPCLVQLSTRPQIKLDREHTDYQWITRKQLPSFHILDDLVHTIDAALALM